MPNESMTDEEYAATQQQLLLLARLVRGMDLTGFLRRIDVADAIGPVLDPTLYRSGMENLAAIRRMAEGALQFQHSLPAVTEGGLPDNG